MKPRHLYGLTALALSASLAALVSRAQTATDANEGFRIATDPAVTNGYQVSWWGRGGYTYFLGRTESLAGTWSYFPIIEFGHDAPISYGYVTSAPMHFVRVTFLDYVLADPFNADSDGDGLTNQQEFDAKTDAFKVDTDGDGLSDAWELAHGLDPLNPVDALADPDSDGRSSAQEFLEGTDPQVADTAPTSSGTRAAPGQPTVENLSPTSVRLTWSINGSPMLGYLVERSADNITWTLIGFTTGNTMTYDDTKLLPNTAYSYRVKGVY